MKRLLVPVDFSDTSKNAAIYAAHLASDLKAEIILINSLDPIASGTDGTPLIDELEGRKKITAMGLESVKLLINEQVPDLAVSCIAIENNSLTDSLEKLVSSAQDDLIVMGITGSSFVERIVMGSNTIKTVNKNICPVIIVPPYAQYRELKTILFVTDFKNVEDMSPVSYIKKIATIFQSKIYVVNVNSESDVESSEQYKIQQSRMESLLAGYNTEFQFIRQPDFTEAISQFSADNKIDLILIVPRKHRFLSNIFSQGHTKKLAYHSYVPILAIHE